LNNTNQTNITTLNVANTATQTTLVTLINADNTTQNKLLLLNTANTATQSSLTNINSSITALNTKTSGLTEKTIKAYDNQLISSSRTKNNTGLIGTWSVSQHYNKKINVICPISVRLITSNSTGNASIFYSVLESIAYTVYKNGIEYQTNTPVSSTALPKPIYFASSVNGSVGQAFLTNISLNFTCNDDINPAVYTVNLLYNRTSFITSTSEIIVNTDITGFVLGANVSIANSSTAGLNYVAPSFTEQFIITSSVTGGIEVNNFVAKGEAQFMGNGDFPETITGSEQGLAVYWNNSNGDGEVDFLAKGQGGGSGFNFYASNNYTAPHLLTKIDTNGKLTTGSVRCDSIVSPLINTEELISSKMNCSLLSTTKIYYPGKMGAELLDAQGKNGRWPIFNSVRYFSDLYGIRTVTLNPGMRAAVNVNNFIDNFMVYPGFRLQVWTDDDYTGTCVIDCDNISVFPVNVQGYVNGSTVVDNASSCKLWFNGTQL
jgi:hypothetical protein